MITIPDLITWKTNKKIEDIKDTIRWIEQHFLWGEYDAKFKDGKPTPSMISFRQKYIAPLLKEKWISFNRTTGQFYIDKYVWDVNLQ